MNRSEEILDLATALSKAQGEFKPAVFDKKNPHFGQSYASFTSVMASVRDALAKNGLAIVQVQSSENKLETTLLHSSGQWISGETPLLIDKNNMQGLGSAITYAKRYAVSALLGVVADSDDDANDAVNPLKDKDGSAVDTNKDEKKKSPSIRSVTGPKQETKVEEKTKEFM